MNLKHNFWYFTDGLKSSDCKKIIKLGKEKNLKKGTIGDNQNLLNNNEKVRDSDVSFFNDKWVYTLIHPFIHLANKNAEWNFQWDWSEDCQFTTYGKNQHYDWHTDSWEEVYKNHVHQSYNDRIRKLSVTVLLNDPKEFEGGELEISFRNKKREPDSVILDDRYLKKGSVVVFPSFIWHRVKPVTKGIRYSLVIWNLGYPFV